MADLVYLRVRDSLAEIRDLLGEARMFNPATSTRRFYVAIPHPLGPFLAQSIHDQLAKTAPGISVEFSTRSLPVELTRKLEDGRVDLAIDWIVPEGKEFRRLALFDDHVVLMARSDHPANKAKKLENIVAQHQFVAMHKRLLSFVQRFQPVPLLNIPAQQLLELSEHMEVLLTASRSERIAIAPRSLVILAIETFSLEPLALSLDTEDFPVNLV